MFTYLSGILPPDNLVLQSKFSDFDHFWKVDFAEKSFHHTVFDFCRQEAILAAISEKDAHIALLEVSPKSAKTQEEIERINKEKDVLQSKLKELVRITFMYAVAIEMITMATKLLRM